MAYRADDKGYRFDTQRITAGYDPYENLKAVSLPIYATAAFEFEDVQEAHDLFGLKKTGFLYTRDSNPTNLVLEEKISKLDGAAGAVTVASGMAAISNTIFNLAEGGGRVLVSPYIYGGSVDGFKKVYEPFGIHIDTAEHILEPELLADEIKPDTRAIFVESISNPNAYVLDIDAIAKVAHDHGIVLVVDNTGATPYLYKPFEHGADIVVYSATKGLNGHGNAIAGIVLESGKFNYNNGHYPQFDEKYYTLRDDAGNWRTVTEVFPETPFTVRLRVKYLDLVGSVLSPFDAYLTVLGIETLSERLSRQSKTALKLAQYLEDNEHVNFVRYPGLFSSSFYDIAKKNLPNGAGGILSFGFIGSQEQKELFLNSTKLFHYHVNLGDVRSLIVDSPDTTHSELEDKEKKIADIPDNLIRISAGLEDVDDLIADLEQAFKIAFSE